MKTVCVYHSRDLDGWMSTAIVKHWWTSEIDALQFGNENTIYENGKPDNSLTFIGYDYGQLIPDLSNYDKVIMCDVSFPAYEMCKLYYNDAHDNKLIWIDHHASAIIGAFGKDALKDDKYKTNTFIDGLRDTKFAACELTWKYFFPNETMPEIVRLLGRYDCFGHTGTDEEQKVLEFQYGARQVITNCEEAYDYLTVELDNDYSTLIPTIHKSGKVIYQYLCTEAKQTYSKAFPITLIEPTSKVSAEVADGTGFYVKRKFLCVNQERFNPINFGIDYHKDGYSGFACFWYKDGKFMWSLYNDNGKVDCSLIAKGFGGGGHKGASGMVLSVKDTIKLIT